MSRVPTRAAHNEVGRNRPTLASMLGESAAFFLSFLEADITDIPGPPGDGHAVLVLPAVMRGDGQTARLRAFLAERGYAPFGWRLGVNLGPMPYLMSGAMDRLSALAARHGRVSVVGFSMGGLFARWLGLHASASIRQVITVCAPFRGALASTWFPLQSMAVYWPAADLHALSEDVARPLPVPGTYIYCRSDGVVDWRCCLDPDAPEDNFEITGHHTTVAGNPEVRRILLERLARPLQPR